MTAPRSVRVPVISIADLLAALGRSAPWDKAADWDPVGLQIGDPAQPARRVATCHEVSEAVVAAMESDPVDLLVSYHPLLFTPTTRLVAGATPAGRALRLARAGVALAVVHTSFDVAPGGAADALADALELEQVKGFAPLWGAETLKLVTFVPPEAAEALLDALVAAGAGTIGNYGHCAYRSEGIGSFFAAEGSQPAVGRSGALNREPELRLELVTPAARVDAVVAALVAAHPYEEPAYDLYPRRGNAGLLGRVGCLPVETSLTALAAQVAQALGDPPVRVAGDPEQRLLHVAVVPGAGADLIEAARAAGAQVLVSGDLTHHRARAALDAGLSLIDPGHVPSERPGLGRLLVSIAAQGVETLNLFDLDPDPWWSP